MIIGLNEYPFKLAERDEMRVFPDELEKDPFVAFHATSESLVAGIIATGFSPKPPLTTVSFATTSNHTLTYIKYPDAVILQVRFRLAPIVSEQSSGTIYVPQGGELPMVEGFCRVPSNWKSLVEWNDG